MTDDGGVETKNSPVTLTILIKDSAFSSGLGLIRLPGLVSLFSVINEDVRKSCNNSWFNTMAKRLSDGLRPFFHKVAVDRAPPQPLHLQYWLKSSTASLYHVSLMRP